MSMYVNNEAETDFHHILFEKGVCIVFHFKLFLDPFSEAST